MQMLVACARLARKHQVASSRQAISHYLGVLEQAGLIASRRDGRCKLHYLDRAPIERIAERWRRPK
jgi:DNA-binding transcriptional ArsR family regulator